MNAHILASSAAFFGGAPPLNVVDPDTTTAGHCETRQGHDVLARFPIAMAYSDHLNIMKLGVRTRATDIDLLFRDDDISSLALL